MPLRARRVLEDANEAISAHSNELSGPAFRASWLAIVTLLRSVGHVLQKVDSIEHPHCARAIKDAWSLLQSNKPEPAIFWAFIEAERNRFLKNYEHGIVRLRVFRSTQPGGQVLVLDLANATRSSVQAGTSLVIPDSVPHKGVFSTIADGPFAGRPEREVAKEAAAWWRQYLEGIEGSSAIVQ